MSDPIQPHVNFDHQFAWSSGTSPASVFGTGGIFVEWSGFNRFHSDGFAFDSSLPSSVLWPLFEPAWSTNSASLWCRPFSSSVDAVR